MIKLKHHIFIPSKNRPDSKLVKLLLDQNVSVEDFTVVVEPQNLQEYKSLNPQVNFLVLPESNQGIAYVRNFIKARAISLGLKWYWMLDDDIDCFYKTVKSKNVKVACAEALNNSSVYFENNSSSIGQAALEYQQFAWSSRKAFTLNSYCDVCVCINTVAGKLANYDKSVNLKEDRDFTLQILANGYDVMRVQKYSFSAPKNGSNKGGLADVYAEVNREEKASKSMNQKWGDAICKFHIKPDGRPDVKINWRYFKKNAEDS